MSYGVCRKNELTRDTENVFRSIPPESFLKGPLLAPFFELGPHEKRSSAFLPLWMAWRNIGGVVSIPEKMVLGKHVNGLRLPGIHGDNECYKYVLPSGLIVSSPNTTGEELAVGPNVDLSPRNWGRSENWQRIMEQWRTPQEGDPKIIFARYCGENLCDLVAFDPEGTFESVKTVAELHGATHTSEM